MNYSIQFTNICNPKNNYQLSNWSAESLKKCTFMDNPLRSMIFHVVYLPNQVPYPGEIF